MTSTVRRLVRLILLSGAAMLAVIAVYVGYETSIFLQRSPENAAQKAQIAFEDECKRRGLHAEEFTGPEPEASSDGTYAFVWRGRRGDEISVLVLYLPYYTERWYKPADL